MTNTTTLLADAEKRVEDGGLPDEVYKISDASYSDHASVLQSHAAAHEAGRLAGVAEGKRDGMTIMLNAVATGKVSVERIGSNNEYRWWLNSNQDVHGTCYGSLIEYLEQRG